jgi:signal transduction histidine kinase
MLGVLRGADASIGAAAGLGPTGPAREAPSGPRNPLPRLADLQSLVEAVRQTGRTVTYNVLGEPPSLPASVDMTVYRVVQEALTNAVRYAADSPVDIQVIFSPTAITVFVDDEGGGVSATAAAGGGSGHGLVGMQERLAAVGGTLEAGPKRPGPGWRVYATIPLVLINLA